MLGHTNATHALEITDSYVGNLTREHWNKRVFDATIDPWGPQFSNVSALDHMQKKVMDKQMAAWQATYEPDAPNHQFNTARKRVQRGVGRERWDEFVSTAPPAPRKTTEPLSSSVVAAVTAAITVAAAIAVVAAVAAIASTAAKEEIASVGATTAENNNDENNNSNESADLSSIDPRFLDVDALSGLPVDAVELSNLDAQFLPVNNEP